MGGSRDLGGAFWRGRLRCTEGESLCCGLRVKCIRERKMQMTSGQRDRSRVPLDVPATPGSLLCLGPSGHEEVWPLGFMHTLNEPLPHCFLGPLPGQGRGRRPGRGARSQAALSPLKVSMEHTAVTRGPRSAPKSCHLLPAETWVRAPKSWLARPMAWTRTPGPLVVLLAAPGPRRWYTQQTWGAHRRPPGPPWECPDSTWPTSLGDWGRVQSLPAMRGDPPTPLPSHPLRPACPA